MGMFVVENKLLRIL